MKIINNLTDCIKYMNSMKKLFARILVLTALGIGTGTTVVYANDSVQGDINSGATPLTTSQMASLITGNTIVGQGWYSFYPKGKKRLIRAKDKTYKGKWKVDEKGGFCAVRIKTKKNWDCHTIWQIDETTYRIHNNDGKHSFTVTIEQGNSRNLK